jgi:hypothetical protein
VRGIGRMMRTKGIKVMNEVRRGSCNEINLKGESQDFDKTSRGMK